MVQSYQKPNSYNYSLKHLIENSAKTVVYTCARCKKLNETPARYHYEGKICHKCSPKDPELCVATLSADIQRVVNELKKQPTLSEYCQYGKYTVDDLNRAFRKDWPEILVSLGYKIVEKTYCYQDVVQELERLSKKLSKLPNMDEYMQVGKIDLNVILSVSKSTTWVEVTGKVFNISNSIVEIILDTNHPYYQEELTKLKNISDKLKRVPTIQEAIKYGVKVDLLAKRLKKTWLELLLLAGISVNPSAMETINQTKRFVKNEELLEDVNSVAKELGYYPDTLKYDQIGAYSSHLLLYRFTTSWLGVLDLAKTTELVFPSNRSINKEKTCLNQTLIEYFSVSSRKISQKSTKAYKKKYKKTR